MIRIQRAGAGAILGRKGWFWLRLAAAVLCVLIGLISASGAGGVVIRTASGRLLGVAPRSRVPRSLSLVGARVADVGHFTASYEALVTRFLTDVASDSGRTSNEYSVTAQYGRTAAPQTSLRYHVGFSPADVLRLSEQFPSDQPHGNPSGCAAPSTVRSPDDPAYTSCLTDAQIQQELSSVIAANALPHDLSAVYFLLLPPGVDVCASAGPERPRGANACADTDYCGYHSNFPTQGPLYAVLPYAGVSGCESGQSPNGDAAADSEVSLLSHEHNDTITDPLLGGAGVAGWYEKSNHAEVSDKCAQPYVYGSFLGTGYNELINSHPYYVQDEFANVDGSDASFDGCEQRAGAANDGVSSSADSLPLTYHGGPVLGAHTAYLIFWDPETAYVAASSLRPHIGQSVALTGVIPNATTGLTYVWNFGDGTATTTLAPTVTHTFTTPGQHSVTLTAGSQTASSAFYVLHDPQLRTISPRARAHAGKRVFFRVGGASDPDGTITTWRWRFGDGTGARGERVSHVYALPGRYTVTLTIGDSNGSAASRSVRVIVRGTGRHRA